MVFIDGIWVGKIPDHKTKKLIEEAYEKDCRESRGQYSELRDFMSMTKARVYNLPGSDFEVRFCVVDYNQDGVFYINLNSKNKLFRKVKFMKYQELTKYREERM